MASESTCQGYAYPWVSYFLGKSTRCSFYIFYSCHFPLWYLLCISPFCNTVTKWLMPDSFQIIKAWLAHILEWESRVGWFHWVSLQWGPSRLGSITIVGTCRKVITWEGKNTEHRKNKKTASLYCNFLSGGLIDPRRTPPIPPEDHRCNYFLPGRNLPLPGPLTCLHFHAEDPWPTH